MALAAVWRMDCREAVAEAIETWTRVVLGGWKEVFGVGMCFGVGWRGRIGCWGVLKSTKESRKTLRLLAHWVDGRKGGARLG